MPGVCVEHTKSISPSSVGDTGKHESDHTEQPKKRRRHEDEVNPAFYIPSEL